MLERYGGVYASGWYPLALIDQSECSAIRTHQRTIRADQDIFLQFSPLAKQLCITTIPLAGDHKLLAELLNIKQQRCPFRCFTCIIPQFLWEFLFTVVPEWSHRDFHQLVCRGPAAHSDFDILRGHNAAHNVLYRGQRGPPTLLNHVSPSASLASASFLHDDLAIFSKSALPCLAIRLLDHFGSQRFNEIVECTTPQRGEVRHILSTSITKWQARQRQEARQQRQQQKRRVTSKPDLPGSSVSVSWSAHLRLAHSYTVPACHLSAEESPEDADDLPDLCPESLTGKSPKHMDPSGVSSLHSLSHFISD